MFKYYFSSFYRTLLFYYIFLSGISAIRFHLPVNVKKCLKEEIHKDVLVTGQYELSNAANEKTLLLVTDSKDHTLYSKEDASKGKFAFTTEEYDMFQVCFHTTAPQGVKSEREVVLDLKHGIEAKDYKVLAEAEKLKPLEVELKRLEELSESIVGDFAYMRAREEEMRDTNESTYSRVLYFSIFSMFCLLALATWQVVYLKRYFKSKKLID